MKWIKDNEGDLINASNLEYIYIEDVGGDYTLPWRVIGSSKESTYSLWEGKSLADAKYQLEDIERYLRL